MILVRGKWTPDMPKDLRGSLGQRLKMLLQIGEQQLKSAPVMIMRHDPSRDTPEPFNAVGVRIIGRCIHQVQMLFQFGEHAAHEQGAGRCVGLEIVGKHDGNSSPLLGTSHGSTHLLTEHIGSASRSDAAIEPAIAPVDQAKAIDPPIISRRFDQALATTTLATPDACQGRVKGHLHLILQIEVSEGQKREQRWQVGRASCRERV